MDRSQSVFNTVVTLDDLNRAAQFNAAVDIQEDIIKSWRLENGFHSFLVDPQGRITAVDPDEQTLARVK